MTTITTQLNTASIARAISAYADAARAETSLLLSTGVVTSDARITDAGENFTGTVRWLNYDLPTTTHKPNTTVSDTDVFASTNLNLLSIGNQAEVYIKNVDAIAAQEASMQTVISKVDGLSYLGSQFGNARSRREEGNLKAVLQGVVNSIAHAADGTEEVFPTGSTAADGYKLKLGASSTDSDAFGYVTKIDAYENTSATTVAWQKLFQNSDVASSARSSFFDNLLDAMNAVSGEFEEPFYYLVINASTYNTLRKENVMDSTPVQDGNISFATLLGGKIRLILTDAANELNGDLTSGVNVSVLVKPGAFAYSNVSVPNPTAIQRVETAANGGGAVTMVSRWGNIIHPRGYSFTGNPGQYPTNAVLDAVPATGANNTPWTRIAENVNQTGIFPIFHA